MAPPLSPFEARQRGILTDRDVEMLLALFRADGALTSQQLYRLLFPQTAGGLNQCYRRLGTLRDELGLLRTYRPRFDLSRPYAPAPGNVQVLDVRATPIVRGAYRAIMGQVPPEEFKLRHAVGVLHARTLLHNLSAAQVWVNLATMMRHYDPASQLDWRGQRLSFHQWREGDNFSGRVRRFAPDALVGRRQYSALGELDEITWYYIEVDLGHETLRQLVGKLAHYEAWYRSRKWEVVIGQGERFPTTLLLTTSRARARNIRDAFRSDLAKRNLTNQLFWLFASFEDVRTYEFQGNLWYSSHPDADVYHAFPRQTPLTATQESL